MGILDKIKKTKDAEAPKEAKVEVAKKETKKTEPKKKAVAASGNTSRANAVLKFPHISEKSAQGETKGHYTFVVTGDADKTSIKDAVESIYGVRPKHVRTMHMEGKSVRFGAKMGRRTSWKKAMVILPKDKTINIHEGV